MSIQHTALNRRYRNWHWQVEHTQPHTATHSHTHTHTHTHTNDTTRTWNREEQRSTYSSTVRVKLSRGSGGRWDATRCTPSLKHCQPRHHATGDAIVSTGLAQGSKATRPRAPTSAEASLATCNWFSTNILGVATDIQHDTNAAEHTAGSGIVRSRTRGCTYFHMDGIFVNCPPLLACTTTAAPAATSATTVQARVLAPNTPTQNGQAAPTHLHENLEQSSQLRPSASRRVLQQPENRARTTELRHMVRTVV